MDKLKKKIAALPEMPGVYIFKDARGRAIYIGKAKSLRKRVQTYFGCRLSSKTQAMAVKIADIDYILTPSEIQAQILEASLIKQEQPRYNISLKDDKSFPWISITDEAFPIVSIARRKEENSNDATLYFGPYPNVRLLRQAFKMLRRTFGFRSCRTMPKEPCLYCRLKLCPAPCAGKISSAQYREAIKGLELFLDSRYRELLRRLSLKMRELAGRRRFEEAAKVRDQISALGGIGKGTLESNDGSEGLKRLLRLRRIPRRIEAFDISNISGKEAAGSMVSFWKGQPDKDNYRRFRIKTIEGIDDYRMLKEIIRRRYSRLIREKLPLPDLILIDGGKGHLMVASREVKNLGLDLSLVGIAKDRENIYTLNKTGPLRLDSDEPALNLIRHIRDEAHRFAVSYHHLLRRKGALGR